MGADVSRPPLGPVILLHRTWQDRTACMFCGAEMPWASMEPCPGRVQHGQEMTSLAVEVRHLRATTIPTRIDAPDGSTAEIIAVTARCANAMGGTGHQTMTVGRWRQDSVREELRDSARGGDREG